MPRWIRVGAWTLAIAIPMMLAAGIGVGWWLLHGSLARLDGTRDLSGLSAPVQVDRDALGVVTIHAGNQLDALRALGYVHAQERFFEMDLMRRSAAGELSELFGPVALDVDRQHRIHRFRARAVDNLATIAGDRMQELQAYTEGINAGLHDLQVRPWPYLLLGVKPQPWRLADTPLVGYAMFFELQGGDDERELALWNVKQHVPRALWALLARDGTRWDAPLQGQPRGDASLPDAATLDLRTLPMPASTIAKANARMQSVGSNNFAVSGALTRDARAILADDMHLGLRVPGIWFRARLLYPDAKAEGGKVDVSGFTLPGNPGVVVGSNTHVAWGFTNSYGDFIDWFDACPWPRGHPRPACAAQGDSPQAETRTETIHVKGAPDVRMSIVEDRFGPVVETRPGGRALELFWIAHLPAALNLGLGQMARAGSLDDALQLTDAVGIPEQNLLLADSSGRIAWRLIGRIPDRDLACAPEFVFRIGALPMRDDPLLPQEAKAQSSDPAAHTCPWAMTATRTTPPLLAEDPRVVQPPSGRLWTANNRTLDGTALAKVGDGGYALGARAKQIRDDLFAQDRFTEKDLLAIQLDDRALFLQRWWTLLQATSARANTPALRELAAAASHWDGRADPASVSYRLVRAWRTQVLVRVRDGLLAPAQAALGRQFIVPDLPQFEGVAWPLVTRQPDNLLPRRFAQCAQTGNRNQAPCQGEIGWTALFEDAARHVRDDVGRHGALAGRRWGERNTAAICHPLARALPHLFRRWLCMPPDELAGDADMPRVAAPDFGASERMVVAPGHEAEGIIQMPGGQSGNPLSPFWGAGHEDWVQGRPSPFLPGPTIHRLNLRPSH